MSSAGSYYLPNPSPYPLLGSICLFCIALGGASFLNDVAYGSWMMGGGLVAMCLLLFFWFGRVIAESPEYNNDVSASFRVSMSWFIFSEVMFFAAFFGALYYVRQLAVPWLADTELLWTGYEGGWPTAGPAGPTLLAPDATDVGPGEFSYIGPWELPLYNTLILMTSSVTCTLAHHALIANHRKQLIFWLALTVGLGYTFLYLQGVEYAHAYNDLGLTLGTGVYGSTFFMLTGFHGFHVTLGAIILTIVLIRCIKGHFTPDNHFAFEAGAWYWHFVDVVWVGLFIFVYIF